MQCCCAESGQKTVDPQEKALLLEAGALKRRTPKAVLLTLQAAVKIFRQLGLPEQQVAAVAALQAAPPLTGVELEQMHPEQAAEQAAEQELEAEQ